MMNNKDNKDINITEAIECLATIALECIGFIVVIVVIAIAIGG